METTGLDYNCKLTPAEQDKLRMLLVRQVNFNGRDITGLAPGTIGSADLADGAVIADALSRDSQSFNTDIVFSATDNDTVAWTSGTLTFASGESFAISSGNTGNMSGLTYIYFAFHISTTVLQTTTTFSTAVGDDKRLLCVANKTADATQKAFYIPAVGVFGINETQIGANSISTGKIQASAITANEIAANTITAAKMNVSQLSAISADIGSITAGTITGNTIRNTSSANSRIQLNTTAFTVTDSGGTEFVKFEPSTIGVKVYFPSIEQHANIGGSFTVSTRPNTSDSDILIISASGTNSATKGSSITLTPGAAGVGNGQITFATQGTTRFALGSYGLIPAANNTYDLGSSSNKFKDIYYAGTLTGVSVTLTGNISQSSATGIGTAFTGMQWDDTNGLLGFTNVSSTATECLKIQNTTTKLRIGGTYYTLSVVAGVVNAT